MAGNCRCGSHRRADQVRASLGEYALNWVTQEHQLGTGHAVLCALPHIPDSCREVVILCGDVPLIQARTVEALIGSHLAENRDVSVLAVDLADPTGYGRILLNLDGRVQAIVEEADASAEQKRIKLINTGIFCVKKDFLLRAVPQIRSDNAQGEIYLTDIVEIAYQEKKHIGATIGGQHLEVTGINTIEELKRVERAMKKR